VTANADKSPDFDKRPLVPAVVQDIRTGQVRMLGYMDREAFAATLATGELHFHSRSRGGLWKKGESSGNLHRVVGVSQDCDADALLVSVIPAGPTCHTGAESCFFDRLHGKPPGPTTLGLLESVIASRNASRPEGSYTAKLLEGGTQKVAQKVGEEAIEVVVAALAENPSRLVEESADLLYHLLVLWADRGVTLVQVLEELQRRGGEKP
jgi:phosphoribosyl-ATP pyrophosphohydrolase/phosphoribosyl-AMP cyclohydrolase